MVGGRQTLYLQRKAKYPWLNNWESAKRRCLVGVYKDKGLKFMLSKKDIEELWKRDKAYSQNRPSINRINSKGHYTKANCEFIELSENIRLAMLGSKNAKLKQWARKYKKCLNCGTTKRIHAAQGLCFRCYARNYWRKHNFKNIRGFYAVA